MPINTKNTKNQHDHRNRPTDLLGWGMTLLHEMLHTPINGNLKDDMSSEYSTGPVVDYMNRIRIQLNNQGFNFGIRKQYMAFPYGNKYRINFSKGQYVEF